jgi:hypothetical protein
VCYLFPRLTLCFNIGKKRLGQHFGRFFHKRIRSPCFRPVSAGQPHREGRERGSDAAPRCTPPTRSDPARRQSLPRSGKREKRAFSRRPGTDVMIFKIFSQKIWRFVGSNYSQFLEKNLIITLDFEKNANFFDESGQKSQKIVIRTSNPGSNPMIVSYVHSNVVIFCEFFFA